MNAINDAGFALTAHPPYSSDLGHSDFYLFPKMIIPLQPTVALLEHVLFYVLGTINTDQPS